jgi:hypothetical protein
MSIELVKEVIYPKGAPIVTDGVRLNGQTFLVQGKLLKTATLKHEWQEDVDDPAEASKQLKQAPLRIDLLRFWQRIPEQEAKYSFYREWCNVAAIPIKDYQHWWDKQIRFRARNKMRKAQKLGVVIQEIAFSDEFVRGVVEIYNQSPVRRGKPFRHYGKEFETVKAELSVDLDEAVFVAAYYEQELIGFIKFVVADRYAMVTLILDKIVHRDKSPTNGMIAKVVEICAARKIPYFTYTLWRRGDHGRFQESVGFEKFPVPEYYIPLTLRGKIALRLRLHRGLVGLIPEPLMVRLLALRTKYYHAKFGRKMSNRSVLGENNDTVTVGTTT